MPRTVGCILLIACSSAITSHAADRPAHDPPQGRFYEQYYSLYLDNVKCGWARDIMTRKGAAVITQSQMSVQIARDNAKIKTNRVSVTKETIDGQPLGFYSKTSQPPHGNVTIHKGTIKGDEVIMAITQGNQTIRHRFALPAGSRPLA